LVDLADTVRVEHDLDLGLDESNDA